MTERFIEYPAVHNTFTDEAFGVFEYGVYPESSVLAGQERRSCLGIFATKAAAQAEFPGVPYVDGSRFIERTLPETPPPWFDPTLAGESWSDDA